MSFSPGFKFKSETADSDPKKAWRGTASVWMIRLDEHEEAEAREEETSIYTGSLQVERLMRPQMRTPGAL